MCQADSVGRMLSTLMEASGGDETVSRIRVCYSTQAERFRGTARESLSTDHMIAIHGSKCHGGSEACVARRKGAGFRGWHGFSTN